MKKLFFILGIAAVLTGCNQGGTGDQNTSGGGRGSSASTNQDQGGVNAPSAYPSTNR